mmetsp:Transcript_16905/g.30263  ORF Transcript_16905/g.30263 Transcript_16905/m.30263 type:complete len:176 (-) Transcript_16905:24-551(-)
MVKASILLLGLVAFSTAFSADEPVCVTLAQLQQFNKGVLDGLEANPSSPGACYKGFTTFNADADKVIADVQKLLAGDLSVFTALSTDLDAALAQLKTLETPCNFADLITKIKTLAGPDGQSILIANYLKHSVAINNDLAAIKTCSADSYKCGKAAGDAIKTLVGYTINPPFAFLA